MIVRHDLCDLRIDQLGPNVFQKTLRKYFDQSGQSDFPKFFHKTLTLRLDVCIERLGIVFF
jgi:hypothetical protein